MSGDFHTEKGVSGKWDSGKWIVRKMNLGKWTETEVYNSHLVSQRTFRTKNIWADLYFFFQAVSIKYTST